MVEVHPLRIPGRWSDGRALDVHTVRSTYLGDDEFGHRLFETTRSPIGELLYRLKYRGDRSVVGEIADAGAAFVREWRPALDLIVPVPPSRERAVQPVLLVGAELAARLTLPFCPECVRRTRNVAQLKDVFDYDERWRLLEGLHEVSASAVEGKRVLLFDDLFRSGATMNSITAAMFEKGGATAVFALTLTRTRSAH
jgi:predicted amidophosphoribosyltransferase